MNKSLATFCLHFKRTISKHCARMQQLWIPCKYSLDLRPLQTRMRYNSSTASLIYHVILRYNYNYKLMRVLYLDGNRSLSSQQRRNSKGLGREGESSSDGIDSNLKAGSSRLPRLSMGIYSQWSTLDTNYTYLFIVQYTHPQMVCRSQQTAV